MSERVKLFEPCYMEYKEYDKPVYYSDEFLQELASCTNGTNLVFEEHLSESIGEVTNFTFTDGALFGDVSTDKSLDNLKYSPYINCSLEEQEDYWLAIRPTGFREVTLTENPRKPVSLPNTNDGGRQMTNENSDNETIKILNGQVKDLNKELAIANNKLEANKDKLKKIDEMEAELEELRTWKADNEKIIEEQKPIIEAYKADQETKRSALIEKLSRGNEEAKVQLQEKDLETLEFMDSFEVHEQPPQGIAAHNAEGLNEGDGSTDEEAEQQERQAAVEGMFGDLFTKEE
jgi:hypothetical protein